MPAWLRFRNSHVEPGDGLGDGGAGAGMVNKRKGWSTHINTLLLFYSGFLLVYVLKNPNNQVNKIIYIYAKVLGMLVFLEI